MGLMKRIGTTLLLSVVTIVIAFAQPTMIPSKPDGTTVSVPFVGCASTGQIERLEAPAGTSKPVPISRTAGQALAYYKSADGLGILAPRGWYCEGASGSGGYALFLSPKPIRNLGSGWEGLDGPAIEVNHMTSGASGMYEIAEIMARVFPAFRESGRKFLREMDRSAPTGPFFKDTLVYRGKKIVEYITPPQSEGLGNFHSWLGKNGLPIRGAAIIVGDGSGSDGPDVVLLSVRVPFSLAGLVPVIVGEFERDTTRSSSLSR